MPKIYCSNCGNAIQYSDIKPNFCQKCGTNLNSGKTQIAAQPKIEIIEEAIRPKVNNLNWDIEINKPKGEKIKDLASGKKIEVFPIREPEEILSKEEFLQKFKKEAGTLRDKNYMPSISNDDDFNQEFENEE